jgi:hypothetical protein
VRLWLDVINLVAGQDWQLAITKALRDSSHVIVLISKASVGKRGYVQKEVRQALDILATFPPNQTFVIPVRLDVSLPEHDALARLHWVDFFDEPENAIDQIAKALSVDVSAPPDADVTMRKRPDAADAVPEQELVNVLKILRGETKFFWPALKELPPHRDNFTAEMQATTFDKIKGYLHYLASKGHLTYGVEHAYDTITNRSPVLTVTVENVTTQLKNLAKYVASSSTTRRNVPTDN